VSSSSRAAPGVRRRARGRTVAAASCSGTGDSGANRGTCGNSAIAQRRTARQLEGNQRKRSSLISREVGGWVPVAGTKNRGWCLVLLGGRLPSVQVIFDYCSPVDTRSLCSYLAGVAEAARRRDSFSPWPAEPILEGGSLVSKLG